MRGPGIKKKKKISNKRFLHASKFDSHWNIELINNRLISKEKREKEKASCSFWISCWLTFSNSTAQCWMSSRHSALSDLSISRVQDHAVTETLDSTPADSAPAEWLLARPEDSYVSDIINDLLWQAVLYLDNIFYICKYVFLSICFSSYACIFY